MGLQRVGVGVEIGHAHLVVQRREQVAVEVVGVAVAAIPIHDDHPRPALLGQAVLRVIGEGVGPRERDGAVDAPHGVVAVSGSQPQGVRRPDELFNPGLTNDQSPRYK